MRFSAVVLAAGLSQRMGAENKLLLELDGRPLLAHAVTSVRDAVDEVVVVTGHEPDRVSAVVEALDSAPDSNDGTGTPVRCVHNPDYEHGMGGSLACGAAAASASRELDGLFIHLGDIPAVQPSTVRHLADAFAEAARPAILFPVHDGRRGHPVLFDAAFLPALTALSGDTGAKPVVRSHPDAVAEVPVNDPGIHRDVDTKEAYRTLRSDDET